MHPYDLHDRTWKTNLLFHTPEPSYLLPGFNINTENSYVGLLHSIGVPYHKIAEKRFDRELQIIGQHVCWLNSISTASQEVEDQLIMIQLSRFGDIYSECFNFHVTPSPAYAKTDIWFDPESHREQVLHRSQESQQISQKSYHLYDTVPFLHDILFFSFLSSFLLPSFSFL